MEQGALIGNNSKGLILDCAIRENILEDMTFMLRPERWERANVWDDREVEFRAKLIARAMWGRDKKEQRRLKQLELLQTDYVKYWGG